MQNSKAYLAEFIGTFGLVFIGAGSICTDAMSSGGVGLLGVALAHGLVLALLISALMRFSGGHFNPAVSIALWITKKFPIRDLPFYILFQLLGAIVGAIFLTWIFPFDIWQEAMLGTPVLGPDVGIGSGIFIELLITFFLVFVVFGTAADPQGPRQLSGLAIGLTLAMDIVFSGPLTGGAANPARAFGPALVGGYWENHFVYWIGPILGGIIAGLLYQFIARQKNSS
jgi:aquaporin Z